MSDAIELNGWWGTRRAHAEFAEHAQRQLNTLYRAAVDNATIAQGPMMFRNVPLSAVENYMRNKEAEFASLKEGKMASKKKAARKRAPKLIAEKIADAGPTIAERLEKSAAQHNPAPDNTAARRVAEIQANAMFIAAHFLEALGFSDAEISVVFQCGTSEVRDRIVTGGGIAKLNGIAVQSHAERFRAMRESQWATGARVAARAMRERIELVLPAAIRASQNYDDVKIERVLDVVRNVLPEDVVDVSAAAKRYAAENEGGAVEFHPCE